MEKYMKNKFVLLPLAFAATLLTACGGGGDDDETGGNNGNNPATPVLNDSNAGTVVMSLATSPACGFDAVNVTLSKIRINKNADAGPNDSGWQDITISPAKQFNLATLNNGVIANLGQTYAPPGTYNQIRLYFSTGAGFTNSVIPTGLRETALQVNDLNDGMRIASVFEVKVGGKTEMALDLDACKSVVTNTQTRDYSFNPVVAVKPLDISGTITGQVDPALVASGARVSAQIDGIIVESTVPDINTGAFKLYPVVQGLSSYSVVITADNRATQVINNVQVTAKNTTSVGTTPITLQTSESRQVTGTVLPATLFGSVTATQRIGDKNFIVGYAGTSISNGQYSLKLPVAAPMVTSLGATVSTPQVDAAGKFTLRAVGSSLVPTTTDVDVTTDDATVNFNLTK